MQLPVPISKKNNKPFNGSLSRTTLCTNRHASLNLMLFFHSWQKGKWGLFGVTFKILGIFGNV